MEISNMQQNKQLAAWWVWVLVIVVSMIIGSSLKCEQVSESRVNSRATTERVVPKEPIEISGNGQTATECFYLQKGLARFRMKHWGTSNFIVRLMYENGDSIGGLINEIGSYDVSKAVKITRAGYYLLDIDADGQWTVRITQ